MISRTSVLAMKTLIFNAEKSDNWSDEAPFVVCLRRRNSYLAFNVERQPISRLHRVEEDATLR